MIVQWWHEKNLLGSRCKYGPLFDCSIVVLLCLLGSGVAKCNPDRIFIYVFMLTRQCTDKWIMPFMALHANNKQKILCRQHTLLSRYSNHSDYFCFFVLLIFVDLFL